MTAIFDLSWLFVFSFVIYPVCSYNILAIFPHPAKSHMRTFGPLMKNLVLKGHNVTVIGHFPQEEYLPNYRDILIGNTEEIFNKFRRLTDLQQLENSKSSRIAKYLNPLSLSEIAEFSCEAGFESNNVQAFLKENNTFDLMIVQVFNTDCFFGLAEIFQCPIIGFVASTMFPWNGDRFGNPDHPAYIPNSFLPLSDKMCFSERVENTLNSIFDRLYYKYVMINQDKRILNKYMESAATNLEKYIYNTSLLLVNSHFTLNLPRPLVPNIVEIAGVHLEKLKPLPKNIEKWITESKEGVIYFSMGSTIKTNSMSQEKQGAFIRAFKRLPQRVIWKWENESLGQKLDNVMVQKWMPQLDILCHPNVKAFISHGGILGTIEAAYCGVPMIVMPQFGDQHTNAKLMESVGGGVVLQMKEATEETIFLSLKKILNTSFQEKAHQLSRRFRDRPLSAMETAIYWVEYVSRHRGAPHIRSAAADMSVCQYYLIDVFTFIFAVLALLSIVLYKFVKFCWTTITTSKVDKRKKIK